MLHKQLQSAKDLMLSAKRKATTEGRIRNIDHPDVCAEAQARVAVIAQEVRMGQGSDELGYLFK